MTVRIGRFEMPRRVMKDDSMVTSTYAKFMAEPFESGYGRTIGNSLRRVLLSSLEGVAISSVNIEGAYHEFCAIPGVVEDVTDIILNLKKVLLRMHCREPRKITLRACGPGEVTAGDIETDPFVEVLNPAHYIATLAEDGKLNAQMEVMLGRGFRAADWSGKKEQDIGIIPIDCIFSPVQRVNVSVENVRVGRRTDYEKLIVEVWTDERITPDDAMIRAATILRHHLDVFVNYDEDLLEFEQSEIIVDRDRDGLRKKLNMSVNEIELSVRAANCLNNANILSVGALAQKTEADMLKYRNFGRKSLHEIQEKLKELELSLGMKFEPDFLSPKSTDAAVS
ncbi:MAG: DNA-directed RNA polymerase subunit alpha [Verrucomicrobia bacterium]|nr:DNA-directed RNA polymerase subunit alpha [Verrucomicrobiota bacterium]MCG2678988.1 DNA-directed RNA polymerase subunit alpha [Kiritimatiellia bacterium]MBU4248340.1 DNA-directed RNA polymerase subunit alpha [Verrucomicrobiota bacterium]MBU4289725.1 DNA-directed RNA polymerase subunit alpha [Verrucomicrobiota bacterium]MBU4428561.1 DNA-directed RNA polymerase subunit alpha [Verrucomicrobiota bacterium]